MKGYIERTKLFEVYQSKLGFHMQMFFKTDIRCKYDMMGVHFYRCCYPTMKELLHRLRCDLNINLQNIASNLLWSSLNTDINFKQISELLRFRPTGFCVNTCVSFLRENVRLLAKNKRSMYSFIVLYSFLAIRPAKIDRLMLLLYVLVHFAEGTFSWNKTK